jgi:predicted Zn-dependent peptidase
MPNTPTLRARTTRARITRALTTGGLAALALAAPALPAQQRETPPAPGTPKDFRLPPKTAFALGNGMQVVMVPFGVVPKATVRLVLRGGNVNEGPNEVWLADLTGELLQEGTTTRTAQQVSQALADMGGALGVAVTPDETRVDADVLTERVPDAVRLLADVVRNPRLPASELPRVRASLLRQLSIQRSQPQPLAQERFSQLLYGDHPYGRVFPTEAMLSGYTVEQVRKFYAGNYGAARATLYVAGVFDRAATERAVRAAFGDWARGAPPAVIPPPKPRTQRQFALVDRANAPQSTIYLGLAVPDPSARDWIALQTTNALLGGSFGSRITTNIREQKGYTYSPASSVQPHYRDANWVQVADVTTNVTGASLKEIFGEVDRLRKEAPPQAELRGIQNNLAGYFTLQNASRGGVIDRLAFVHLHGLGDDYLTQYVKRVLAVTPADVQRITRDYLRPERMTLVIVGDRKLVEPQVAPYVPPATVP